MPYRQGPYQTVKQPNSKTSKHLQLAKMLKQQTQFIELETDKNQIQAVLSTEAIIIYSSPLPPSLFVNENSRRQSRSLQLLIHFSPAQQEEEEGKKTLNPGLAKDQT